MISSGDYAQANDTDDLLDILPAIIAASTQCKSNDQNRLSLDLLNSRCKLTVDADYDLNTATIELPRNIELNYQGGSISNGTLVFNGGEIDGRLLNHQLTIQGKATLKSPIYQLNPAKWDIREGQISKAQARTNRVNINRAIALIQRLGAHTMALGKIDAFFDVGWRRGNRIEMSRVSIRIPSNFHFKMSNNTHLRVFPTDQPAYSLLNLYNTVNSKVSGGHLAGDRYQHRYVDVDHGAAHEFGFCIYVIGAHNAVIENVEAYHATGDGLIIHAESIRNADGTLRPGIETTENLLVKGGVYRDNRRNNIAVVDADGVVFDGITVLRAGEGTRAPNGPDSPAGVAPRYGMDLEANRLVNTDGTLNEINRITDITIRNSTFRGNAKGEIDVYTASNVLIEKNRFDGRVANFASNNVIVQNNVFESSGVFDSAIVVTPRSSSITGEQLTHSWQILGNTIRDYQVAISIGSERMTVNDNKLYENRTGIQMQSLSDSTISNNIIQSSLPISYGHSPFVGSLINNVQIRGEQIDVGHRPLNFRDINRSQTDTSRIQLTVEDSVLRSKGTWPVHLSNSKNIAIQNSSYTNDIEVLNSTNIKLESNVLVPQ